MNKSRNMSRVKTKDSTPFLPKLSIEVWFETWPFYTWSAVKDQDDYIFKFYWKDKDEVNKEAKSVRTSVCKAFRGTEYLYALLAIKTPQQLVSFMNRYACPIDGIVQDPVDGEWHSTTVPFRWCTFIEAQSKLMQALRLPIPKLLRHAEFKRAFNLETLTTTPELRNEVYCLIVTMSPSLDACCRVIAVERLLANVEYRFCELCGKPYQVTSKHKRKYCETNTCGHAVAQQGYREREKHKRLKKK